MPDWLWTVIVGGVVLGLISILYVELRSRMMTKDEHAEICQKHTEKLVSQFEDKVIGMKNEIVLYFDLKIENEILKELRKLNGST